MQKHSGNYEQFFRQSDKSRWATVKEIRSSSSYINTYDSTYTAAGIPILSNGRDVYVDNTDTHSLIFGSTGSKKSRMFCMPLLNIFSRAGESFIVTDPKGELYEKTSGAAKENGYNIITLDYRNLGMGDMWNPLSKPYELYHSGNREEATVMLNDFVSSISEPYEKAPDPFWTSMASSLAIAILLLLMECGEKDEVHPASFAQLCSSASMEKLEDLTEHMNPSSIAGMNFNGVFVSADKTRDSIFVSLFAMVKVFNINHKLTQMLSQSSFDICSIGREKTAVYIIVPDEKTTYNFLVTTFIKQAYQTLINESQKEQGGKLPIRVNFVLDEFCNVPRIGDMPSMISAARSRNMRFYLVVQSMYQLRERYGGAAETIKGNCENWFFLASKELELLNEISQLCGSNDGVPLISPSELQHLSKDKGEVLVMHGRDFPIVTELADIDDYEPFCSIPAAERTVKFPENVRSFDLSRVSMLVTTGITLFDDNTKITVNVSAEQLAQNIKDAIEEKKREEIREKERLEEERLHKSAAFQRELQEQLEAKFNELFGNGE